MRRLRLGMIGGGPGSFMGPVHRIAARLDDRWVLVAGAFSSNGERNAAIGQELGLDPRRVHDDWRALVGAEAARADDRLDAIAVVTPNHLHAAICVAALEAGFHVICDKPLAIDLQEATGIEAAMRRGGGLLVLTQTYSAYPMIRHAKWLVSTGALGALRVIQVQYAQSWLAGPVEQSGPAGAAWRTDPTRGGMGGVLGDIGTHAYHLAGFVTGLAAQAVQADLSRFVAGRQVPDNAHLLLRYPGGVRGMLWASQVAPGRGNDLRIAVYGDAAGLEWRQEAPNQLHYTPLGAPTQILERGAAGQGASYRTRLPDHHPEGYLEAFAELYAEAAELISARQDGRAPADWAGSVPGVADGIDGLRFVTAALASAREERWIDLDAG